MKIVLVDPPLDSITVSKNEPAFSLGLLSIKSYLQAAGFNDVEIHSFFNFTSERIRQWFEESKPRVVGIGCCSDTRLFSFELARMVKALDPTITVILGNIHASFFPEQIIERFPVDVCVIGEGEETMVECVRAIRDKSGFSGVRGVVFRENGKAVRTGARPLIRELDAVPFAREKRVFTNIFGHRQGNLLTSRGCPFDCAFCSSGSFWGRTWRKRTPEKVVEELEYLVSQGAEYVDFLDDLFTADQQRAIGICNLIRSRGLEVKWCARARVDTVSAELLDCMKDAGCWEISCGVESGSEDMLKIINKRISLDKAVEAFRMIKKRGIVARANFIVGHPGETDQTIRETVRFVRRLDVDDITMSIAKVYPNTYLNQCALEKGLLPKDFWVDSSDKPVYYTVDFTLAQLRGHSIRILMSWLYSRGPVFFVKFFLRNFRQSGIKTTVRYCAGWLKTLVKR